MKTIIPSTKNYSIFTCETINRPIDLAKHKRLYTSMKEHGFIPSFPLTVKKRGDKYVILDGQHRWALAQQLNLEVYYVIIDDSVDIDIPGINGSQTPWTVQTYIDSYAGAGYPSYQKIKEFKDKYRLPIGVCAALLAGTVSYQNVFPQIRNGTYKIKDVSHAELVGGLLEQISIVYKKAKEKNFIDAICAICRIKNIDLSRLVESVRKHPHMMQPYGTRDTILTMLENVYNFGRRTLYPLAINAQNEMKKRNVCEN